MIISRKKTTEKYALLFHYIHNEIILYWIYSIYMIFKY